MGFVLSFIKIKGQPMGRQVCLTMPANVLMEGIYLKINLELNNSAIHWF